MKNLDCNIDSISFSFYTADEIRKLSTKEITSLVSIESVLGKGAVNGLYDTLLGSLSDREPCRNCNLSYYDCNGHFGRIEFSKPIYNPMLMDILAKLIKGVCFYCHRFNYGHGFLESICDLSNTDDSSNLKRFHDLENFKSKSYSEKQKNAIQIISSQPRKNCEHCQNKSLVINKSRKCEFIVHISSKTSHRDDEPNRKKIKLDDNQKLMKFKSSYTYEELYGRFRSSDNSLNPEILREHLRFLWFNEENNMKTILPLLNNNFEFPTDIFFMENMLINPPMNRLPAVMHGDNMTESPETSNMCNVIRAEAALREIIKKKDSSTSEQFYQNIREGILELQKRVNICYDSNKHKEIMGAQPGLRQKIDKKEGLFRSNIMGKRVNFACRSVISPDPTIGLDEIGVPIVFLIKLSFPEPLNYLNKDFLKQCVLNGPDVYPGAVSYQIDDRPAVVINRDREATVEFLELMLQKKNKVIINRHAISGDVLIMNRQPTLHRPSMQAHVIKAILDPKAKTIRMHYSNCKAYNADFDGDEMNGHYLQSILAQSEAKLLVNTCHQHSTPKDGSPLAGLIQDHVIAGTRLCMRDVTLTRNECLDLVIYGLQNINTRPLKLPKPALLFPKRLWTGKQVLSTIIKYALPEGLDFPNIVCEEPKKNAMWKISLREKELKLSDVDLIIINGYICCGIFDKVHIGPSQKGLCSDLRELYGSKIALDILTCISRALNRYLIYSGFTTGIKDGFLNKTGETVRENILSKIKSVGLTSIAKAFNIPIKDLNLENTATLMEVAQFNKSDEFRNKMSEIDTNFKSLSLKFVNQLGSTCKDNLRESFPYNNLSFMSQTGAKGGESNITKIAIGLGAIEIEGKRCPLTIGGRTLPSFKRYDFDPASRGFCLSRFVSGLKPQELYFESMAGRDGLVDTAVKTSSSGYLQRCLIKHLEDITISYDGTVRDNMHNIIEFKYGYDGLDVVNSISLSKSEYMDVIGRNLELMQKKYIKKKSEPFLSKSLSKKINACIDKLKGDFVSINKDQEEMFRNIVYAKCVIAACAPGEAVGLLAAQSIGEPSTQMTLNTFHNAGQSEMNVTLGIPRLREILMIGSENINTPSMSVPIINSHVNIATEVKKFTKLYMKDVIELPFKISVDDYFEITFTFKKEQDYISKTDLKRRELISLIEKTFFKSFSKALKKIFKQTSIQITDDKDDDVMPLNDNCQDDEKIVEKEDNIPENVDDLKDLSDLDDLDSDKEVSEDEEALNNSDDDDNDDGKEGLETNDSIDKLENSKVKDMFGEVFKNYKIHHQEEPDWIKLYLDLKQSKFDVKSLLLNIFETTVLSSVDGVSKALIISKNNSFATEGYNHTELFKYDSVFDLNKFYSNNIVKMSKLYGIETAIRCIEKEVKTVFQSYSIEVNSRHLRLIADFLTYSGSVGSFSRHKMINHSSPIQRASYETTLSVLNEMMVYGTADYIKSPSSNIMFGQPVSYIGSNAMELCYNKHLI